MQIKVLVPIQLLNYASPVILLLLLLFSNVLKNHQLIFIFFLDDLGLKVHL